MTNSSIRPIRATTAAEKPVPCGACRRDARAQPCGPCPLYGAWLERRGHAQGDVALRFLYEFWATWKEGYWGPLWRENAERQRVREEAEVAEIVRRFPAVTRELARSAVTAMRRG